MVEVPKAHVASSSGLEDVDIKEKQKAFHITWRWHNKKQHNIFQKEVKECVAASTPKIIIPIIAVGEIVGLNFVWQGIVKEVAYWHLDLTIQQFWLHTLKQWDALYEDLGK